MTLAKHVQISMLRSISHDEGNQVMDEWKDMLYSEIWRLGMVKISDVPKLIYRVNAIVIQILGKLLGDKNKIILKCVWKIKELGYIKQLKKKNELGRTTLLAQY